MQYQNPQQQNTGQQPYPQQQNTGQQPYPQQQNTGQQPYPQQQNTGQQLFPPNRQQPGSPNPPQQNIGQSPYPQRVLQPYPPNIQQPGSPRYQYNFDEQKMRRYFYNPARIWIWIFGASLPLLFLGILLILAGGIGAFFSIPFIVFGLLLFAVGGIPLYIHYTQRPTSEQYEGWITERCEPLYSKALQRLHLDEKDDCESIIEVRGGISSIQQLTKKFPEKEIVVKRLQNGFRHYSINSSIYIFLTRNNIAIYSGYINALAQHERFEDADRYYYQDIVAVSTTGPMFIFENGSSQQEIQMQGFLVRVNNGDAVGTDYAAKVILRNEGTRERVQGVDQVVPELLRLLKDHKDVQ